MRDTRLLGREGGGRGGGEEGSKGREVERKEGGGRREGEWRMVGGKRRRVKNEG